MKILEICQINPSKRIDIPEEQVISFVPMDAVTKDGKIDKSKTILYSRAKNYSVFQNGDVLFAKITPCMENGKGCIAKNLHNGFGAGSTEFIVLRPKHELVTAEWIYYFLSQKQFRLQCQQHMTGSAGQKRVPQKYLETCEVPVPSICDQRRIIARIEELFSELDNGVETLRKTKQQLAVYRQAVLKEAFSHIAEKKTIREMSSIVTSGSRGWAQYYSDHGAKFIRIGNLTRDRIHIDLSDIQYVALPDDAEGKRTQLQPNDVLVSITADLGSVGLVPDNIGEAYVNQHIAMIRFHNPVQGKMMAWYLRSDYGQEDLLRNKRGGGKLGLGLDDIRDSRVPVVSDKEAKRILEMIDARLSACDSIEKTVDTALQQAEAMRQSILKRAFEGRV
ncbi:MAG: restriction endonuclease subunit S [Clostridiales bacterium]|nr:restriction endonuclease subunit S [Clostridiales bacterium]